MRRVAPPQKWGKGHAPCHPLSAHSPDPALAAALVRKQGAFESLEFERCWPTVPTYIAKFASGKRVWVIMPLTKDGKMPGLVFRPFPP